MNLIFGPHRARISEEVDGSHQTAVHLRIGDRSFRDLERSDAGDLTAADGVGRPSERKLPGRSAGHDATQRAQGPGAVERSGESAAQHLLLLRIQTLRLYSQPAQHAAQGPTQVVGGRLQVQTQADQGSASLAALFIAQMGLGGGFGSHSQEKCLLKQDVAHVFRRYAHLPGLDLERVEKRTAK